MGKEKKAHMLYDDEDWGSHIKDPILLFSLVGEKRVGG